MNTNKIKLTGISETLLITLWARAVECENPSPFLIDNKAKEIISQIDYNFAKFKRAGLSQLGVSIRSMILDNAVKQFIQNHQNALVINLGAGLDTRFHRLNNSTIDWYDLDVPEAIALKKKFISETDNYHFIAKSMFEPKWMDNINVKNRPVLIIAEGLFMYFTEEELKPFVRTLIKKFPNAELLFDVIPPFMIGKAKIHDSVRTMKEVPNFKWGILNCSEMELWHPQIKVANEWRIFDYGGPRWGWFKIFIILPFIRKRLNCKVVRLEFLNSKVLPTLN